MRNKYENRQEHQHNINGMKFLPPKDLLMKSSENTSKDQAFHLRDRRFTRKVLFEQFRPVECKMSI